MRKYINIFIIAFLLLTTVVPFADVQAAPPPAKQHQAPLVYPSVFDGCFDNSSNQIYPSVCNGANALGSNFADYGELVADSSALVGLRISYPEELIDISTITYTIEYVGTGGNVRFYGVQEDGTISYQSPWLTDNQLYSTTDTVANIKIKYFQINIHLNAGGAVRIYAVGTDGVSYSYLSYIKQTDALSTYPRVRGTDFTIALIDTGIDTTSSKFNGKVIYQYDYDNNDSIADDANGHGTHMASAIVDVCPECRLAVYKVNSSSPASFKSAFQHIIQNKTALNIAAVNLSLGLGAVNIVNSQVDTYPLVSPTIDEEIKTLYAMNVPIVTAGGNYFYTYSSALGLTYPATSKYVISVGSVFFKNSGAYSDATGAVASTSGGGRLAPFTNRAQWMTVLAPGVDVPIVGLSGATSLADGSSISAAIVSGTIGLIQSKAKIVDNNTLSVAQIITALRSGPSVYDGDDEDDNVTNSGTYYKLLDVLAALGKVANTSNRLRDGNFEENSPAWQKIDATLDSGRMNVWNAEQFLAYGPSACGDYYYVMGGYASPVTRNLSYQLSNLTFDQVPEYSGVFQQFRWEGGSLYYKFSVRNIYATMENLTDINAPVYLSASLTNVVNHSLSYPLLSNQAISKTVELNGWQTITGTITSTVPAGDYRLTFMRGTNPESHQGDAIGVDNIYISEAPITTRPCDTPTFALFPTPTPGLTPTAQAIPFSNCGFEQGASGWSITAPAAITNTVGAPQGSYYLYNPSSQIKAVQYFNIAPPTAYRAPSDTGSGGRPALGDYVKLNIGFFFKGAPVATIKKFGTNAIYTVIDVSQNNATPNYQTDWQYLNKTLELNDGGDYELRLGAAGSYTDPLNPYSFIYSNASFDAITLSFDGQTVTNCGLINPTATPTGAPTRTPTPPFMPTWTQTPRPTTTPFTSPTPRLNASGTPLPPDSAGGRPADPGLPPSVACEMPGDQSQYLTYTNWWYYLTQIPAWISYTGCSVINFFQFSRANAKGFNDLVGFSYEQYLLCKEPWFAQYIINSNNTLMIAQCQTYKKFPFGLLMEIIDALKAVEQTFKSYNWTQAKGLIDSVDETRQNCYTNFNSDYSACLMNWVQGLDPSDGILTGKLELNPTTNRVSSDECQINMSNMFGPYATRGMCFTYNTIRDLGFMMWIQFFFDVGWLFLLVTYFQKAWISRA